MTVGEAWAEIARYLKLDLGSINGAFCNGQPVLAEHPLGVLAAGHQAVQVAFVLKSHGPHLVQLTLRDCKQDTVCAACLKTEVLASALHRWASNLNLPMLDLQFFCQGQPVNMQGSCQALGLGDGDVLDVVVWDSSASGSGLMWGRSPQGDFPLYTSAHEVAVMKAF